MENTANILNYTGIVTLSQYIGDKKIKIAQAHNEGKIALFDFLADCLIGDFDIAKINRPTAIRLLNKDKDGIYKGVSGLIYLLNKPEKLYDEDEGSCKVCYSFSVSSSLLEDEMEFTSVGLYSRHAALSEPGDFAAVCDINNQETSQIDSSSVLIVDWELIIANKK